MRFHIPARPNSMKKGEAKLLFVKFVVVTMGIHSSSVFFSGMFALFVYTFASPDVFDSVLGSTASCHKSCEMTHSLHTYPRGEELYACQRGCRLFSICQFVHENEDLNQTKSECELTCDEAYVQQNQQSACYLGCDNQLPFAVQHQKQLEAMMPRIRLIYPLTLVRGFWDDLMSQAHSFITSSWTFHLQADEGKVVIFQAEPQIKFSPQFDLEEVDRDPWKSFSGLNSPVYKEYRHTVIQERDRDMTGDHSYDEYDVVSCLSRNIWIPSWILAATLILSVVVFIWICCATMATAVEQYVPAEKLSIYGDRDFITEQKLKTYPASSLPIITPKQPEENAGPLPTKMSLAQSKI